MRKAMTCLMLVLVFSMVLTTPAYAMSLGDWATSYGLQGTSEVFYSAPWLVRFVQFFISWVCIIAFLTYYMSFLCSIVVLSNKELFYTIDALKRDTEESGDKKGKAFLNGLWEKFRSGSAKDGLNGGADNIAVFFLMLSLNFKAYSVYKNVEADSGDDSGSGRRFAYSDTMASFFLKSLFDSVMVTFILSIALSGLLIRVWFTLGDVLIFQADRFAQTNLVAWVQNLVGTERYFNPSFMLMDSRSADIADTVLNRIMAQGLGHVPNIEDAQIQALGVAVEDNIVAQLRAVANRTGLPDSATTEQMMTYAMVRLANENLPAHRRINPHFVLAVPETQVGLGIRRMTQNNIPSPGTPGTLTFNIGGADGLLQTAGTPPVGMTASHLHVAFVFDETAASQFLAHDVISPFQPGVMQDFHLPAGAGTAP